MFVCGGKMIDVYCGNNTHPIESECIYSKKWVFMCLTSMIQTEGDYIVRKIAGIEILLMNVNGGIGAYENRCPHRGMNIKNNKFGSGKLACDFHAWTFKADGGLHSVPYNDQLFCFGESDLLGIKLRKFKTLTLGKFVFVNLSNDPLSIDDQISIDNQETLIEFSRYIDDSYSIARLNTTANWKLIVEITMDELHVPFVHNKTLAKLRKYTPSDFSANKSTINFKSSKDISFFNMTPLTTSVSHDWYPYVDRLGDKDVYYDLYIYPNLHVVCADGGYSFSYEAYFPDENGTNIDYLFSTAKIQRVSKVFPIVHYESLKYGLAVYKEDLEAVERMQSAGNFPAPRYGAYECRIQAWREYFAKKEYANE
jgi:phenylpropionate dioxygenase-like ring-hydroxylating dioxygenase large terminal subunit